MNGFASKRISTNQHTLVNEHKSIIAQKMKLVFQHVLSNVRNWPHEVLPNCLFLPIPTLTCSYWFDKLQLFKQDIQNILPTSFITLLRMINLNTIMSKITGRMLDYKQDYTVHNLKIASQISKSKPKLYQ